MKWPWICPDCLKPQPTPADCWYTPTRPRRCPGCSVKHRAETKAAYAMVRSKRAAEAKHART